MKKTALVGAVASLCLVGSAGTAALATAHHPSAAPKLKVTVSPTKPKSGATVVAKLSGGLKKTQYYCLLTTYHKGSTLGAANANTTSLVTKTTNKKGKSTCKQVFLPFSTPSGHKCPPSKADKKAGWKCGVAFAQVKNHKSYKVGLFKF